MLITADSHCCMQKPMKSGGKPVSDQWIPSFVITDKDDNPVGPIEVNNKTPASHGCQCITALDVYVTSTSLTTDLHSWSRFSCDCLSQDGDAVVIFNFRADRVVELSKAFEYKDFKCFDRKRHPDVSALPPSIPHIHIVPSSK